MKTPLMIGMCLLMAACTMKEESAPALVVNVKTARAEVGEVSVSVSAPATIFPRQKADIAAPLTANIQRLLAQKGDRIKAGQVLAELENRDLMAQRDEAAAAKANAEASLQKISLGSLPTEIERAHGEVASAEALLNQTQKIYDRRRELFAEGAIPNRDLLASETDLTRAKIAYEVAQKSLDLLMNQSGEHDIQIARSRLDQANARLNLLNAQLEFTKIQSPFNGTIIEQYKYAGDMARPDAPIFTVIDFSIAVARVQIPESRARGIHRGEECVFSPVDAPESEYRGKLTLVNRSVDPNRRTVEAWCEIPHPDIDLRDGEFGSVRIVTDTVLGSVLVPLSAVQFIEGTQQGFVMVVDSGSTAHKRDVRTGEILDDKVQIIEGIHPGEIVITEGGYGLPDGVEVKTAQGE
jgi:multidrug efflux pump subunit AcrA (membrane-fusion protein)